MAEVNKFIGGIFPDVNAPESVKNTPEYGLSVAKAIHAATKDYIVVRNAIYRENRLFAKGKQSVDPYLDTMNIDGKQAFININFDPRPIAKKFVRVVVGGYMNEVEKPKCTAINPTIAARKTKKVNDSKYRSTHADFIKNAEAESGMQFEDPSAFTPETEEDADFYYGLNDKEREEILLEMMIQFAVINNDIDNIKRSSLRDLLICNVAMVEDYMDNNNRLRFDYVPPEEQIYGPSKLENFKDSPYFGRWKRMSIADFRVLANGELTEKQIWSIAKSYSSATGNTSWNWEWDLGYAASTTRPYDSLIIDVMKFWYKTVKDLNYVTGKDNYNREVFDMTEGPAQKTNPNKQSKAKVIHQGYEGYWPVDSDFIIKWGKAKNELRRDDSLEDVNPPFNMFMIENDGEMDGRSMIDDMKSSIMSMDITILKIQQIKAQQAPNGFFIDIDGLEDIDLGLGSGALTPLKLREIRMQTGDVYYRSKSEAGDINQQAPIRENKSDFGNVLEQLIADYNFELNNIRDYIGVNEYRDGSGVNPKTSPTVVAGQVKNSNTATSHIYDAWTDILKGMYRHAGQRIWDSLSSSNPNNGYRKILGKENMDFIKEAAEVCSSIYDINIEPDLSQEQKQQFEQELQIALSEQTIDVPDIIAIRKMPNLSYAAQYMYVRINKKKKDQEKLSAQMQQQNAQLQQQSLQQKAELDAQTAQLQARVQVATVEAKTQGELEKAKITFYNEMRKQAFILGRELPDDIKAEISQYYQEQAEMKQAAAQQAEAAQQADAQEQAQGQQGEQASGQPQQ